MRSATLGSFGEVSRLTLGGGGVGALWGETTADEGIATLREAVDLGITLLDAAPGYKACERLIGEAFDGRLPDGVRATTKCGIGNVEPGTAYATLRDSLENSLKAMRLDHVDLFFLHNPIAAPEPPDPDDVRADLHWHTPWKIYADEVVPAFERIVQEGLAGAWGITGVDTPTAIVEAMAREPRPTAIQAVANLLDSAGSLTDVRTNARPRDIIAAAVEHGVGVMGIRAAQAGALTAAIDRELPEGHPELPDYERAAPFRALCAEWGEDPAIVAHRYALAIPGVDTVVLGVKNRFELRQLVAAEEIGPLEADGVTAIDALGIRVPAVPPTLTWASGTSDA